MESFLLERLTRISALAKGSKHKALREACDNAYAALSARVPEAELPPAQKQAKSLMPSFTRRSSKSDISGEPPAAAAAAKPPAAAAAAAAAPSASSAQSGVVLDGGAADEFFDPLQKACQSGVAAVMEMSLDCLQKLIAYGYLRGDEETASEGDAAAARAAAAAGEPAVGSGVGGRRILMDRVIDTVCECNERRADGASGDAVQLQVIKALLTAVSSTSCAVHSSSLLLSVKTCYNIHLISRSVVNRTTAKGALTQMLSIVFARMERAHESLRRAVGARCAVLARPSAEGTIRSVRGDGMCAVHFEDPAEAALAAAAVAATDHAPAPEAPADDAATDAGAPDDAAAAAAAPAAPAATPAPAPPAPTDGMVLILAEALDIRLTKDALTDTVGVGGTDSLSSSHLYHRDALLLLKALCKLSMKQPGVAASPDNPDGGAGGESAVSLQSKLLSLELLLSLLEVPGFSLRTEEKFVSAVQQYLCISLLKNCASSVTQVVGLSLRIFVALLTHYKDHLKAELEVFVTNIFLRILESGNSTYEHKHLVLKVFHTICQDPATLAEIFLNYDAASDYNSTELFRHIVDALAKSVKGGGAREASSHTRRSALHEESIRTLALQAIVATVGSLAKTVNLDDDVGGGGGGDRDDASGAAAAAAAADADTNQDADDDAAAPLPDDDDAAPDIVGAFAEKKRVLSELRRGIALFNTKPKKGLAYLDEKGYVQSRDAKSVAAFLHEHHETLDATVIGDYLGKGKDEDGGFPVAVLHEFVDSMDFAGLEFDEAIRVFLAGFRLPGEAQKIDRMMEKYAERYCIQNKDKSIFPSADTAFVLAFSVIMLQTDLHNPSVAPERKMTEKGFVGNNRGIADGGDLDPEYLRGIYRRIKLKPISLKEDDQARDAENAKKASATSGAGTALAMLSGDAAARGRRAAFDKEKDSMVKESVDAMVKQRRRHSMASKDGGGGYVSAADIAALGGEYVQPMFDVAWGAMLSAFSAMLDKRNDAGTVDLCLRGMRLAVRVAGRFDMSEARASFVNSLAKLTCLHTVVELNEKHLACISMLLDMALVDGDLLGESWGTVLRCVSQLARLQIMAEGLSTDDRFFSKGGSSPGAGGDKRKTLGKQGSFGNRGGAFDKLFGGPSATEVARTVESHNAELVVENVDVASIDRVFAASVKLSDASVKHFVVQLCRVSHAEVNNGFAALRGREARADTAQPRVFSLQKLVEVADYNMEIRGRMTWSSIWNTLSMHFANVGSSPNDSLAMYAVDSLRQLSMKFLEKEELREFNFQRLFLKPFETIMAKSDLQGVRELILSCIEVLVARRATNIRSGWKSIFAVLAAAANCDGPTAVAAFGITANLTEGAGFSHVVCDFIELVQCLMAFAKCTDSATALSALGRLEQCGRHLGDGTVLAKMTAPLGDGEKPMLRTLSSASQELDEDALQLWWPLLVGLSGRVSDHRLAVRSAALKTLHTILFEYGSGFSTETWKLVFRGVMFPVLESAWTDYSPQPTSSHPTDETAAAAANEHSWLTTTAQPVFSSCIALFQKYHATAPTLLGELLALLSNCVCQNVEALARIACASLHELVRSLSAVGRDGETQTDRDERGAALGDVCNALAAMVYKNLPARLSDMGAASAALEASTAFGDAALAQGVDAHESSQGRDAGPALKRYSLGGSTTAASAVGGLEDAAAAVAAGPGGVAPSLNAEALANFAPHKIMTRLVVTLRLQRIVGDTLVDFNRWLAESDARALVDALAASGAHARALNGNRALRAQLAQAGFLTASAAAGPAAAEALPHLLDQEVGAYASSCTVLVGMCRDKRPYGASNARPHDAWAGPLLVSLVRTVLASYLAKLDGGDVPGARYEMERLEKATIQALDAVGAWDQEAVVENASWLFKSVVGLIPSESVDVRRAVRKVLEGPVANLLGQAYGSSLGTVSETV